MPRRQDYLVGLDLGSYRTRVVVAIEEDSRLRLIATGEATVEGGWENGAISDQDPVLASLEKAIEQAEQNGGMLVETAVVGVGGPHVRSNLSRAPLTLSSWEKEIERKHVEAVTKLAVQNVLGEDRALLQAVPIEFSVDQQSRVRNPLGMAGKRLDARCKWSPRSPRRTTTCARSSIAPASSSRRPSRKASPPLTPCWKSRSARWASPCSTWARARSRWSST
ncbi:MAG: cell division protein FtsA [Bryobacterales bacterium]